MANVPDPNHYVIEYARPGSNEKCNGPPPCKGSTIVLGDLRFGTKKYDNKINDKFQYRHWGCVTPDILYDLAFVDVNRIPGVDRLNPADRLKIHTAVERLAVDDADIPVTARRPVVAKPSLYSASQATRPVARPSAAPFGTQRASVPAPAPTTSKKRKAPVARTPSLPTPAPTPSSSQSSASLRFQHAPPTQITMSQQQRDDAAYLDDDVYDEEEAQYTDMYLSFQSQVVGIQYYDGLVGPGEQVNLVREPTNKYDRNAIQVMNMRLTQVGHIPRQTAASLAPLIDKNLILVEGTMNDGNLQGRQYTLSVTLTIYGKPGIRSMLEPLLTWATPGRRGFTDAMRRESGIAFSQTANYSASSSAGPSYAVGSANNPMYIEQGPSSQPQIAHQRALELIEAQRRAHELNEMLSGLQKVDDEGRRANFLDALYEQEKQDILNLPEHPSPPGIDDGNLTVNLLKHQKQGLLWCIERESVTLPQKDGEPHQQFWEYRSQPGRKGYYVNMITKTPAPIETPPAIGHGGIMSDSMGLGKSLTFLALIVATKKTRPTGYDNPTLVVCPLSVLGNWESQIASHCVPGVISTYTYYGDYRNADAEVLKAYDVVLTTYQTVTADYAAVGGFKTPQELMAGPEARTSKKRKTDKNRALFEVNWKRVVLDEAHHIKNPKAKMSQAASALEGYYRWAVSGTPIVNSPSDLGSLLTFLRMCTPLDQIAMFNRFLSRPLSKGEMNATVLLKQLMKHISIRRSKEMQDDQGNRLVELPKVTIHVTNVELDEESRRIYDTVERLSRQRFVTMANAAEGENIPNVVLSLLTRMRQIALHPGLVPADYLDKLRADEAADHALQTVTINSQEKARLQNILFHAEEDSEECAICFDTLRDPRILPDGHYFCFECIAGYIQTHGSEATCPMDRRPISMGDLIEPAPPTDLTQAPRADKGFDDFGLASAPGSSPKIDRLIQILKLIPGDDKAVVFSQFTSFLDKIADQLEANGISFVEFNGALSAKRRQEVLNRFSIPLIKKSSRRASDKKEAGGSDSDSDYDISRDEDYIDEEDGSIFGTQSTTLKGKGKGKGKAAKLGRSSGRNPQVLLISLKSGATGLNLTVANHLFLMDPWWQEAIESQAIDRVNRIGQKKEVQVYQMITTNTVESKVLDIQARKKAMIDQAFSGMGGREVVREKREARMQDFIELFGLKREGGRVKLKDDDRTKDNNFIVDDDDELDWVPTRTRKPEKRQEIPVDSD